MAKARKWTNFKGQIPDEPVEVTERELKIRSMADERRTVVVKRDEHGEPVETRPAVMRDFADEYQALVEEEEFAALEAKQRSMKYEALERLILAELKKVEELSGQDMWRGDGQTFSPQLLVIPTVVDKGALMKHIKDTGQEALLTLSEPRLKSVVTSKLEELESMTPAQRAETGVAVDAPIPGVKIWIRTVVHRTAKS